ncbi:protein STU1-like [Tripterygium wilfordii]|uniref:Protein STU1-like n=1 Tax=Tripterygium wilfordii TaxID=458696 RepID=A0A7J7DEL4_TRIWF|nr:uncharacterized protein LOC120001646 [Tripterygium wilfordii]XP_038705989.1 uncharacterized protein LOC120001646 [Tripterygium wilfordii]KAF5744807.1 protein STU1-like [Tripterygium wilfordii]
MSEGPKLYTNKPKKAQLKQCQVQQQGKGFTSPSPSTASLSTPAAAAQSSAAASYKMGSAPPPPPQPPKESFARRYKFLWPILLTVNIAVGGYLFMRTKKKDTSSVEEEVPKDVPSNPAAMTAKIAEETMLAIKMPTRREPIPEDQQRELFKWMLEEKRKVKPKDPEEKKHIDEEKAILKQFIRAKSIPSI